MVKWFIIDTAIKPGNESKVVELSDGSWMINSRVNGKGIRYVHVWKESMPAWSNNGGKTWTIGEQPVFDVRKDSVQVKGICQFGQGYAGAIDNYVYVYLAWHESSDIYLGRVKKKHLFDRSKYKYFVACNKDGSAKWTS